MASSTMLATAVAPGAGVDLDDAPNPSAPTARADWTEWALPCSIALVGPNELLAAAVGRTRRFLDRVADAASGFDPDSEISRANAAGGASVAISPLCAELVAVALRAAAESDGAVDPTVTDDLAEAVRAAVRQHRSGQAEYVTCPELDRDRRADWRSVRLDAAAGTLMLPPDCRLDLHATTGAWAADRAAQSLAASTGRSVLVGIGGDLAAAGPAYPWTVRVGELAGDGQVQRVTLHRGGLATSTAYARPEPRDRPSALPPMPRVIDPRTGLAIAAGRRSVTAAATSTVRAQTAALAGLVDGPEPLTRLLADGGAARIVEAHGTRRFGGWPAA